MTYSLGTWGPTGGAEITDDSFTVSTTYTAIISKGAGRSVFIPITGVSPSTHSAVCIPVTDYPTDGQFTQAIQFTPIVSEGGVTVYFGSPAANTGPTGSTPQRLLVMRFR
jgi:hypothetical protein